VLFSSHYFMGMSRFDGSGRYLFGDSRKALT